MQNKFFPQDFVNEKRIYQAKSSVSRIRSLRSDMVKNRGRERGNAQRFGSSTASDMTFKPDHEHGSSSEEEEDLDGVSLNHGVVAASGVNDLVTTLTEPITEATGDILEVTQELLNSIADTMVINYYF